MVCHIGGQLGTKVVISALGMLALYMCFNGTGIWGGDTMCTETVKYILSGLITPAKKLITPFRHLGSRLRSRSLLNTTIADTSLAELDVSQMIKEADALTSPHKEMARVASTLSLNTVEEEPTESLPSEPQSPGQPPAPDHSTTLNKSPQLATTKAGDKDNDRPTPVQKRNKKQKAKKEKQQKCKHGHCPERKSTDPLLRCCTCMTWHHPQCVGDAKGDGDFCGAWTCHQCRLVPAQIRQLEKTISQISRDVQTIKQVQSSHSKMQKSLDEAQLNNQ